jgi:hypothetical protein
VAGHGIYKSKAGILNERKEKKKAKAKGKKNTYFEEAK